MINKVAKEIEAAAEVAAKAAAEAAAVQSMENVCMDNDYCSKTGHYCGEWAGATLRKIPAWEEEKDRRITTS